MTHNDLLGGPMTEGPVPRIESLRVKNYRALRDFQVKKLTPFSVLLGPNGSGKSTVFDVFAFLCECFSESSGLRRAWDRRGRFRELRTRGEAGPIEIELTYREDPDSRPRSPLITYHLSIDESERDGPFVGRESLRWARQPGRSGRPFSFLDFEHGKGLVTSGEKPDEDAERTRQELVSADLLAVNTLGQLKEHPRVSALRRFILGWYLSYITANSTRIQPEAGPHEHLSPNGDNLPNVIQHLMERDEERLRYILGRLSARVPCLEEVRAQAMADGRLLLQVKDAPFDQPIQARFVSDGTLKMLAFLTVLYDPAPPPLIGIEEPENHLHPRLLPGLAEECRMASGAGQLLITTHSPYFVDEVQPEELWILSRGRGGHTRAHCSAGMSGIREFVDKGGRMGDLWMEGYFDHGLPSDVPASLSPMTQGA